MHETDELLISKKDLLQSTGISYGQLYRWKRQNLIPEAWFIKQSAFTGQETFFPKDKILKRVQMITDLKDQYSLEELAEMLSPSTTNRVYESIQLSNFGFSSAIVEKFQRTLNKETFNFRELIFLYLFDRLAEQNTVNAEELTDMIASLPNWLPKLKNLAYVFVVCRREDQGFAILLQQQSPYFLDNKTKQTVSFDLEELGKDLNLKLNKVLEEELR
ncbi:MAG TPA: DUF4004 family protein [Candidatus Deferrimicrobium sp.]|nr:DUF4004 family protein [Candidatus Deferrimicrobium sp.]